MSKNNIIIQSIIFSIMIVPSLLFGAGDPFATLNSNISSTIDSIVLIIQVVGGLALALFGGFSLYSGNLDKIRLIMIIVGIVIVTGARSFVELISSWVN